MEQYINKSAVVAEIDALQDATMENGHFLSSYYEGMFDGLSKIENFLNTIETKEVDLEEECKIYLKNNFTSKEAPDEFLTTLMQIDDMVLFAKHFFEMGIKAQKGE